MIEDGEVDLDPGWDTAPLPPIEPILERDLPVDLALSGVMGVPEELFRPGRAGKIQFFSFSKPGLGLPYIKSFDIKFLVNTEGSCL